MRQQALLRSVSVLGFLVAVSVWVTTFGWAEGWGPTLPPAVPVIVLGATLMPLLGLGRWLLDLRPTPERAAWTNVLVHYGSATPLGAAIVTAIFASQGWPCADNRWFELPCPAWPSAVGGALVAIFGAALALTVVNLAARGLGAPFAIALTTRLASEQLYAWTRNPMVLAGLSLLVSIGVRLGSWWLIAWAVLAVTPVMLVFLKLYEERELEIRFGEPYRAYKRRTPLLIPRRPRA